VALVAFAAGVASLAAWTAYRRHKAVVGVPPVSAVATAPGVKLSTGETRASNLPPGYALELPAKPDTWQKDRECAAQAEEIKGKKDGLLIDYEKSASELAKSLSVAQQLGAVVEGARSGKAVPAIPIKLVKGLVNHYSPKYGTCFLRATYTMMNIDLASTHLDRATSTLLVDAFGGGLLADLDFNQCYISGKSGADCAETKSKIDDAMTN
jgi:hypothetical protein